MDIVGFAARMNTVSFDYFVQWINHHVFDSACALMNYNECIVGENGDMSLLRRAMITWIFIYLSSLVLYFVFASLDYYLIFIKYQKQLLPNYKPNLPEIRREIYVSSWSLAVMSALTVPMEILIQLGYGKIYHDPMQYGLTYLIISPILFLVFSDSLIYWIHRGLHHPLVYKTLHKLHHSFVHTTPYSAFAFHPLDGFAQGLPYQVFVMLFPFHSALHMISLGVVGLWTINIHDRVTLNIPYVNGAAHHDIHHTTFRSNYGQYFIFWDKLFGTFRDPKSMQNKVLTEEEVYGKKNL